jgi:hypothetical protein
MPRERCPRHLVREDVLRAIVWLVPAFWLRPFG